MTGQKRRPGTIDALVAVATVLLVVALAASAVLFGWVGWFAHPLVAVVVGIVICVVALGVLLIVYRRFVRSRPEGSSREPDRR